MSTLVTGVFRSRLAAETAAESLAQLGVSRTDISLLMSDQTHGREFSVRTETKAPEGAAAGAAAGGTLGALIAGLAAVGTIVIPGLGLLAAGPIVAILAGAGAGGAAGGLIGALVGAGIPEHEARFIHDEVRAGGILVGAYVHEADARAVKETLRSCGAERVRAA